jgi:NADH dehydrogenase
MKNILVLGGSGFVGRSVCEKLVQRNGGGSGRIVLPTRHPMRASDLWTLPTMEITPCDVHDDTQLQRVLSGCHAVINLVAILHGSDAEFQRVNVDLPRRLAAASAAASVLRMVHVSALGAGASAPSRYQRSKAAGEAALQAGSIAPTVLRPSVMFGEHDRFMNRFAALQRVFPLFPLACADARFQPVWVEDVAAAIVQALDTPSCAGETIECVGPRVYTLKDMVQLAGRWAGCERPVIALPAPLGRLQAMLLELLPGDPPMSRDNIDSMKTDNVAGGTLPGLERFGISPRAMDSVMPGVLGGRDGPARLEPWRALARR